MEGKALITPVKSEEEGEGTAPAEPQAAPPAAQAGSEPVVFTPDNK
jgi:hypothetical protein